MPETPRSEALIVPMVNAITWAPFAPTCRVTALAAVATEPDRILIPLNSVSEATRAISAVIDCTSRSRLLRWRSVSVPLAAWTARSRTRCSMSFTPPRAPSATCTRLTPSSALREATFMPRIWVRISSLTARPAASSAARLMRRPDESRSIVPLSLLLVAESCRWAFCASTLL